MKYIISRGSLTILISGFMLFILLHAGMAKEFASLGLQTWFAQMIPALLPFMILSGLLIRLDLISLFCKPFRFLLKPLFRVSDAGIYVLVTGFICGFPMGAKNITDLYMADRLTKKEAEYLLAFTNNIGPAFFFSFVQGNVYHDTSRIPGILLQFLIPFLYGLILRHTVYRHSIHE
ncbi:MAG: hypothetical protein J6P60_05605, partial [Lachnospiraceae bacterium]|nr:hypothetical protein [Lachnospiraceae bacterium]